MQVNLDFDQVRAWVQKDGARHFSDLRLLLLKAGQVEAAQRKADEWAREANGQGAYAELEHQCGDRSIFRRYYDEGHSTDELFEFIRKNFTNPYLSGGDYDFQDTASIWGYDPEEDDFYMLSEQQE
jgi:hypothetical protein